MKIEKRRYPRVSIKWPVTLLTPRSLVGGETRNISLGGVFIDCPAHPGQDEPFRVVIKTPIRKRFLLVTARVVWSNISDSGDDKTCCGIALQFSKLFSDDRQFLSEVISNNL